MTDFDKTYVQGMFGEFVAKVQQAVAKGIDARANNPLEAPKAGDATNEVGRAGCLLGAWLGRVLDMAAKSQTLTVDSLPCPFKTGDWLEADRKKNEDNRQFSVACLIDGQLHTGLYDNAAARVFLANPARFSGGVMQELEEFLDNSEIGTMILRRDTHGHKCVVTRMQDDE